MGALCVWRQGVPALQWAAQVNYSERVVVSSDLVHWFFVQIIFLPTFLLIDSVIPRVSECVLVL